MGLRLHQKKKARVTEVQRDGALVVSFDGALLRVQNQTKLKFNVGDTVELIVAAVRPLKFKLAYGQQSNSLRISV